MGREKHRVREGVAVDEKRGWERPVCVQSAGIPWRAEVFSRKDDVDVGVKAGGSLEVGFEGGFVVDWERVMSSREGEKGRTLTISVRDQQDVTTE